MKLRLLMTSTLVLGLATLSANAAPTTFFGEDDGDISSTGSNTPTIHPNSDAARADLFTHLSGVQTYNFDSDLTGATNVSATFGAVTAGLSGGQVSTGDAGLGRFPISGANFYEAATDTFSLVFTGSAVSAFGFYATDVGDFGGVLSISLTDSSNVVTNLIIPAHPDPTESGGVPANGSALYFGFYDLTDTYTSISFNNTNTADTFGFDDFSVGTLAQVVPPGGVPEPMTLSLFGAGLAGAAAFARRRKVRA